MLSRPVLIGRGLGLQYSVSRKCRKAEFVHRYGVLKGVVPHFGYEYPFFRSSLSCSQDSNQQFLVVMAAGSHPFPFRTRKLSLPAPMVLGGNSPGRVGRCQNFFKRLPSLLAVGAIVSFGLSYWKPGQSVRRFCCSHPS